MIFFLDNRPRLCATQAWGQGLLVVPHGLAVDANGSVWVTDLVRHQVGQLHAFANR